MSNVKYSEKDMAALIGEVEVQFAEHLNKAEKETEPTLTKSEEVSEEVIEVATEVTSEAEVVEKSEQSEFNYDDEDFNEMNKLYGSMNKAEAEAHYKSVKKALFGEEIQAEEVKEVETKIEKSEPEVTEVKEDLIAKSEFEAVKEENDKLKKNIEDLTSAIKVFNTNRAPAQKAITQIKYLKKSEVEEVEESVANIENLSKSEIAKKLSEQIRKGASSNDKEKINQYYLDKTSIDTIKHLL
jgi:hypothetical protein